MKRWIALILILLIVPFCATAELSTNLNIRTVMVKNNRRLVSSKTFVDAEGNPVIASDKGYATIKYSYGTGSRVVKEEYLDGEGRLINNNEGFAYVTYRYSVGKLTKKI